MGRLGKTRDIIVVLISLAVHTHSQRSLQMLKGFLGEQNRRLFDFGWNADRIEIPV